MIKSKAKKQYIFIVGHTFLAGLALTFSVHFIHLFSFYCCFILLYIKLQKIFYRLPFWPHVPNVSFRLPKDQIKNFRFPSSILISQGLGMSPVGEHPWAPPHLSLYGDYPPRPSSSGPPATTSASTSTPLGRRVLMLPPILAHTCPSQLLAGPASSEAAVR